jgi:hypothetical protein
MRPTGCSPRFPRKIATTAGGSFFATAHRFRVTEVAA